MDTDEIQRVANILRELEDTEQTGSADYFDMMEYYSWLSGQEWGR